MGAYSQHAENANTDSGKGRQMNRKRLFINSIFLGAALIAPMAITAHAAPQINVRVYDSKHKDYHNWDDREEHSYQAFRVEHPKYNATYSKTKSSQQKEYWTWRHAHPDHN
jgi:hypothetical protein